jgi:hypothetical protein
VRRWGLPKGVSLLAAGVAAMGAAVAPGASAGEPILKAVKDYPGLTKFRCQTDPITIYPGQNSNDLALTQTCPNAT